MRLLRDAAHFTYCVCSINNLQLWRLAVVCFVSRFEQMLEIIAYAKTH